MSQFSRKLKQRYWQTILFLGLVELPPPVLINKHEIDISELVHIRPIIGELIDSYNAIEDDSDFCGCFLSGFGEAIGVVQYVAEEQSVLNQSVSDIHDELDAFSRGELEL